MERLQSHHRALRKHDRNVDRMAESIRAFGFLVPVLATRQGRVVDGELRLKAAAKMGLQAVPVVLADGLSEAQVQAFRIMANTSAGWSGWDEQALALEVFELSQLDFDLGLTGLSLAHIEDLLDAHGREIQGLTDPDDAPEVQAQRVSRLGDVWILGEHRLLCGDSTDVGQIHALMSGELAGLVWTDPPYNVAYEGKAGKIMNDKMSAAAFREFLQAAFLAMHLVMERGAPIYVAHGESEGLNFRTTFLEAGFKLSSCVIWEKDSLVIGRSDYQPMHEPVLYGWKPGAPHRWFGGRKRTSVAKLDAGEHVEVLEDGRVRVLLSGGVVEIDGQDLQVEAFEPSLIRHPRPKRSDEHPTMKPVGLIERFLRNSSLQGDLVLDPFGGSGSTLMACERTGRRCRTMELDPRFVDVIVRRWQNYTGAQALREADGRTFGECEGALAQ